MECHGILSSESHIALLFMKQITFVRLSFSHFQADPCSFRSRFLGTNKHRLYLVFYVRSPSPQQPLPFPTALLLSPKQSGPSSTDKVRVWRFHAVNPWDAESGKQVWVFQAEEKPYRTGQLAGVMLIEKLQHNVTRQRVHEILASVPVRQDDASWWCHHWAWAALTVSSQWHVRCSSCSDRSNRH
jgi:hypothetical protein